MYDALILGAGIAGLSLADALLQRGCSVVVADKNKVGSGASGTPLAMANPATGLRAKKVWRAEACYQAIQDLLDRTENHVGATIYKKNGVLRPALSSKMARKMKERYDQTQWPEAWVHWLDEDQIKQKHPGIRCWDGGLWIPMGLTVDMRAYLQALAQYLKSHDVVIYEDIDNQPQLSSETNGWRLDVDDRRIEFEHLIYATGYGTIKDPRWQLLPLEGVKGQLLEAEPEEPLTFDHSISSRGYIAHLTSERFGVGSTYEHDFDHLNTDEEGRKYLYKVLERVLPELAQKPRKEKLWAGVRVSTPDKKPVLGAHPDIPRLYVFTGLGSKGLLYGRYLAGLLADHILRAVSLPEIVRINRFL